MKELFQYEGCVLIVEPDNDNHNSPSDWDGLGKLFAWHRQFTEPRPAKGGPSLGDLLDKLPTHHVFVVDVVDYGGGNIRLRLLDELIQTAFEETDPDAYEEEQSDFSAVLEEAKGGLLVERMSAVEALANLHSPQGIAEAAIEVWNQYLEGDVWQVSVWSLDEDGEREDCLDSLGGIYGNQEVLEEGRSMASHWENKLVKERIRLLLHNPERRTP